MQKFVRNLLTEWRSLKLPFENETMLVAVSGGADSVGLAIALHELQKAKKLKLNLVIGHFNHNLRGVESQKDAEFVENLAKKLDFVFIGGVQNPASNLKDQKGNIEQLARNARYDFLEKTALMLNASAVLTAHTQNDQAETFLLRLLRGSSSDGLGAMKIVRFLNENQSESQNQKSQILLVRPLLGWAKRKDTESFCAVSKIKFRSDEMNDDMEFSRVRIRKELLPLLNSFNPQIVEKLSNTAFLLQADVEELNFEAKNLLENAKCETAKIIKYKYLAESSKSLRRRALRLWILENNFNLLKIEAKHIEAIESLIFSRKSGRNIELPNGKSIVKNDGKLFFEKSKVEKR